VVQLMMKVIDGEKHFPVGKIDYLEYLMGKKSSDNHYNNNPGF
jgi:hypothetical protein